MTQETETMQADIVPIFCPVCDRRRAAFVPGREADTTRYECGHRYEDVEAAAVNAAISARGRRPILGVAIVAVVTIAFLAAGGYVVGGALTLEDHSVDPHLEGPAYEFSIRNVADQDVAYEMRVDGELACWGTLRDRWFAPSFATCTAPIPYDGEPHRVKFVVEYENGKARNIRGEILSREVDFEIDAFGVDSSDGP